MQKGALKPEYYEDFRQIWRQKQEKEAEKSGIDPEDQAIYALSVLPGWEYLKKHIVNIKKSLDTKLAQAVASGMNEAEIGKSTVVTVLVKECLDSIINKVEDSALTVEEIQNNEREAAESRS